MQRIGLLVACGIISVTIGGYAAESSDVAIQATRDAVEVSLPLMTVTGKVRVKHRTKAGFGEPVAPTQSQLDNSHYLEWQIGYDSPDKGAPNVASNIVFHRKGTTKYGYELSTILLKAKEIGFTDDGALRGLTNFLTSQITTVEGNERIVLEEVTPSEQKLPAGFVKRVEKAPLYVKDSVHGGIEIHLKHKQVAVGYQAMVYVCLPMNRVLQPDGSPRPDGPARTKERVLYRFTKDNSDFLLDIVRAFGLASRQHNEDLRQIINQILAQ